MVVMTTRKSFIDLCIAGEACLWEIDDFVDQWHEAPGALPLHEFLGLSIEEYAEWLDDSESLRQVVSSRLSKGGG